MVELSIYTLKYYSDIKRNAFEFVLMRWMNLEPIIQSEASHKEKDKYHIPYSRCLNQVCFSLEVWLF